MMVVERRGGKPRSFAEDVSLESRLHAGRTREVDAVLLLARGSRYTDMQGCRTMLVLFIATVEAEA